MEKNVGRASALAAVMISLYHAFFENSTMLRYNNKNNYTFEACVRVYQIGMPMEEGDL